LIRQIFPLWSEINSIINSVYGRAMTVIAFFSPILYLYFLPDSFLSTIKIMTGGALLIVASNILFIFLVPSVQRSYPKYVDYEDKCLKLEDKNALDLYEEFGQVSGKTINIDDWTRSGLSFIYLDGESIIPEIDDYKKNFIRGAESEPEKVNRMALSRSLSAIKYVSFDASKVFGRICITITLSCGIILTYAPIFIRIVM